MCRRFKTVVTGRSCPAEGQQGPSPAHCPICSTWCPRRTAATVSDDQLRQACTNKNGRVVRTVAVPRRRRCASTRTYRSALSGQCRMYPQGIYIGKGIFPIQTPWYPIIFSNAFQENHRFEELSTSQNKVDGTRMQFTAGLWAFQSLQLLQHLPWP